MMDKQGELTKTTLKVFDTIKDFIEQNGYSPSVRDVCEILGWASPSTAQYYIRLLEDSGYIKVVPKLARSIRIVKVPEAPS